MSDLLHGSTTLNFTNYLVDWVGGLFLLVVFLLAASLGGLHPGRLTWNIIIEGGKMIFLSKRVIYRFHVNLPGSMLVVFVLLSWESL